MSVVVEILNRAVRMFDGFVVYYDLGRGAVMKRQIIDTALVAAPNACINERGGLSFSQGISSYTPPPVF